MNKFQQSDKLVLGLISSLAVIALFSTAWLLIIKKDYYYTIEDTCNPQTENCFHRDCSIPDECPPNNLSDYKVFKVKASDFPKCFHNSCQTKCATGEIRCEQMLCGSVNEDSCSQSPEPAVGN